MDHVLTNCHCVDNTSSIMCIHSPDNFSDHVPVFFELNVSLPHVGSSDTSSLHDKIDWHIIDSASLEAYKICVRASLPTLSDELQDCSTPDCKSHLTMHVKSCFHMHAYHACHSSVNVLRLCQDGMTLLDCFEVKLYFGIVCGQITVVPLVVFYRKSGKKPSLATSMLLDL